MNKILYFYTVVIYPTLLKTKLSHILSSLINLISMIYNTVLALSHKYHSYIQSIGSRLNYNVVLIFPLTSDNVNYLTILGFIILGYFIYKMFKNSTFLTILLNTLTRITTILNAHINKLTSSHVLTINAIIRNDTERSLQYSLINDHLLSHKDVLSAIYNTLMNDDTFINFGKYKVIIVSAIVDDQEFNYHHNILLTNNTTFDQYYEKVKDIIATHFNDGYQVDVVNSFKITV
jgi:hypothetical protein